MYDLLLCKIYQNTKLIMYKKNNILFILFISLISVLMFFMMKSSIDLYLTEIQNSHYYIYQSVLYSISGFIVIKYYKRIQSKRYNVGYMWIFGILCFLFSFIRMDEINIRNSVSLFFNTFIIPFAFLNGMWIGQKLSNMRNRDGYVILLLTPAIYSMFILLSYNTLGAWFKADAAFCVIVFFPCIFFFKRNWLTSLFFLIFVMFSLSSAKRSILLFITLCLLTYICYLFFCNSNKGIKSKLFSRIFLIGLIVFGIYFITSSNNNALMHSIERIERIEGTSADNGRYEIYLKVINLIYNSNIIDIFTGHGQMAVKNDTGKGAHNDILEIIYDYGIIAAFFYLSIILHFIKISFRKIRVNQFESALKIGISIASIIVLGMLNCIITSTALIYTMFLALGCSISLYNKVNE